MRAVHRAAVRASRVLLRLSLHRRIAVFVVSVMLSVFVAFAFLGWEAVNQSTQSTLLERQSTATVTARYLDDFLADARTSLGIMAAQLDTPDGLLQPERAIETLEGGNEYLRPYFARVVLLDRKLDVFASTPSTGFDHSDPAVAAILDRVIKARTPSISNLIQLPGDGKGILFVAPVLHANRLVGLLAGEMELPHPTLDAVLGDTARGRTWHTEVVDATGQVLASTGMGGHRGLSEHADYYGPLLASSTSATGRAYSAHDGEWHVMAFAPLLEAPWGVGMGQDEAETFAATYALRDRTLAAAGIGLALALFFAWLGTQSVVNPLLALTRAGERMATGDLTEPIQVAQPDEIGGLAKVLEAMRQRLRQSLHETTELNRALEKRVQQRTVELETSNRHLAALMAVATAANGSTDTQDVLQTAMRELVDTLGAESGWAFLFNEQAQRLQMVSGHLLDGDMEAVEIPVEPLTIGCIRALSGSGVACQAMDSCPVAPNGLERWSRGRGRLCWSAPIRVGDQPLGVLCLSTRPGQGLDAESTALMQGVAQQVASAFQNAQLAEERARLQASQHMEVLRAEFVASVSHELRTPLGFIKGYATTLLRRDVSWSEDQERECLQVIDEETDHLTFLVDSLLDLARAQAGRFKLHQEPVDLTNVVRRAVDRISGSLEDHPVRVTAAEPLQVHADSVRLEQVLINLLQNAGKYSPEGAPIEVELRAEPDRARLGVLDRGVGIAPEQSEAIFEPFFRVSEQATAGVRGAGLGLAVCKSIVEAHGGHIWAEPRHGGGTGVYVALPLDR